MLLLFRASSLAALLLTLAAVHSPRAAAETPKPVDANRLTYLDEFLAPYYVQRDFPKLTTPQWVGEPGVEAVVVLAIDDMRDSAKYEQFLRPILDRLKQIDGRAPVSIMTNRLEPQDPQLARWLTEGLSLEVHTYDHPCPCLQQGDFDAARATYERCVDLLNQVPGNRPVAFRMPCCDSLNTPSPRFWAEVFNRTTAGGHWLSIDSSVFQIYTSDDPDLPRELVLREDGSERFRRYVPFPSFVNTIENYPYPYVIGRLGWQFPCMVPSDWSAQHVQQPNNPETVRDMQLALDATVIKQGVFNLVFHPHNWIRNDQVVQLVEHAASRHAGKVKFLTFREADQRLRDSLLAGQSLRDARGRDNGVRLLDLNADGYLDVVIGNAEVQQTRVWSPDEQAWTVGPLPVQLVQHSDGSSSTDPGAQARLGIAPDGSVLLIQRTESEAGAWRYAGGAWQRDDRWLAGLECDGTAVLTAAAGRDTGVRLRDLDGDGRTELLVGNPAQQGVLVWHDSHWQPAPYTLPEGTLLVDGDGRDAGLRLQDIDEDGLDDVVFSDATRFGVYLARGDSEDRFAGWPVVAQQGRRGENEAIPMIVRGGTNNGAWFHSRHLWVQNEDTSRLADHVDRRSYEQLLGDQAALPAARSPRRALAAMRVRAGLKVELVASEPLIKDPVAIDWGPDGKLWVVEMGDYPMGLGDQGAAGGRVRVLSDDDQDGVYDRAETFLDELSYPTGIKVWRDGVLVTAAPEIFFAADRDGDGRADERRTLYRGFVEGNQQHRVNGLRWGLDNWLYVANGDSGGVIESVQLGTKVAIGGRDLRIRPDDGLLAADSGQTQYGRDRDDWDNWFGGNNSNPMWHYVLPDSALGRNPHWVPPDPKHQVSVTPGAAPVYPASRPLPRFNDFNMVNRFTSACSTAVYRDRLLGDEFYGNGLVCEPVHNLVHRELMTRDGVTFQSRRADDEQQSELLASADHWFRPVMVRTGPDGGIWVVDMYRLVIEHPEWIPAEWQARLDLRAGEDRGRIYRLVPADQPARSIPQLSGMTTPQLVEQLQSPNGWVRDMAQQLLLWNNDGGASSLLERLFRTSAEPLARLHALATLDGLNALEAALLVEALADPHPAIRRHAVRLAATRTAKHPELIEPLLACGQDEDPQVFLEVLLAAGEIDDPRAAQLLLSRPLDDVYLQAAAISSLTPSHMRTLLASEHDNLLSPLLPAALRFATAERDYAALTDFLAGWSEPSAGSAQAVQLEMVAEILEGIAERDRKQVPAELREQLAAHVERARQILEDSQAAPPLRVAAVRVLSGAFWNEPEVVEQLGALLSPQQPADVQRAATEGLSRFSDLAVADQLLAEWRSHTPALRNQILDLVMSRTTWIDRLLDAIAQKQIPASHIDASRRQLLTTHRLPSIRDKAAEVLQASVDPDRQKVVDQYASAATMTGDVERGRAVFRKACSVCHRLEGHGYAVGPDLNAITDKSPAALLTAIFDPNRAVEDKFLEFLAIDADGRQYLGMIAAETSNAITLVAQEGKQQALLRGDLEALATTGRSLMPEGLERDLPVEATADLIAYLRVARDEPKSFPGNQPQVAHVRDDGSIRMLADQARIYGPTLVLEPQYRNVGYWGSDADRVVWDIRVPKAGRYRVVFDYACDDAAAGNRFLVQVADARLSGTVTGTGGWDFYRGREMGTVQLPAGPLEFSIRSDGPVSGFLMDLRGVVLDPVSD